MSIAGKVVLNSSLRHYTACCAICESVEEGGARNQREFEADIRTFGWKVRRRSWRCPACLKRP